MISVLYVDDEESLLDLGKLFLEESGDFQVDLMDSATRALGHLKTHRYDAIISDYQMPEMNGLEFLRNVREEYGQIPFILFTGRGREEVVILALNNGADYYLQKGGAPQPQFAELAHKIRLAVQRRQATLALEESERRYRDVVETQTEFISRFLPDGTHVFTNEAYCRYFGKRREEIVGHKFIPPIPREDLPGIQDHFRSLTRDHPSGEIEHRVIMPDGSIRWQWWSDHAFFDQNGRILEYQSVGKDITDRKESERALQASENMYRTIFNTTGAATIIIGEDTTIRLANPEFTRLSGWSSGELEGRHSWTEFIVQEDLERMKHYHKDRRKDPAGAPRVYEFRFVSRKGEVRHCINYVAMIPGTSLSVASVVDIHDRVLAEQDYRSILDNIQDVFYRTDPEGRIIRVSPSGPALLGYASAEELLGRDIAETIYYRPEDRRVFLEAIERAGALSNYEVRIKRKDGAPLTVLASSHQYFDAAGNFRGIEGILRNITERKQAEDDLKKSENLYRAIFDNTGAATIIIAPDTTILLANAGWVNLTGVARSEQENRLSWTVFINKDDVGRMKQYHTDRRKDPSLAPSVYECRVMDTEGSLHFCIVNVGMIPGTANSVASLVDITERRKAEDDLRRAYEQLTAAEEELRAQFDELKYSQDIIQKSERNYRSIIENLQDAFYRADTAGTLLLVSPSFALELGYASADEVIGKNIARDIYVSANDREVFMRELQKTGELKGYRIRLRKKDGTPITVLASSHIFYDEMNQPAGIEGMLHVVRDA